MATTLVDKMRTLQKLVQERTEANRNKRPSSKDLAQYISGHCTISWLPTQRVLEYNLSLAVCMSEKALAELDKWSQVTVLPLPLFMWCVVFEIF